MLKELIARHAWVRFAIIGVAATIIHYGLYWLLLEAGTPYGWAYAFGYGASLLFNFLATARFTFPTRPTTRKAFLFLGCHAINFGLHFGLLKFFVEIAGFDVRIAPVFVYLIVVPVNFFLVRRAMSDR